ncbi:MAG: RNA methyltransferase [Flavobacteriaceae bacterium]|nr:RNA methyltransferase [Bacteroidia bacterium]NNK69904.1 RNA methyltransferase [Flavobacteriaceae bacterium]
MKKEELQLLEYLQSYLTERRLSRFEEVLSNRTRHFTVAVEDVYQLHNTSAVLRSCDIFGIQDVHIIEEMYEDRIDSEIAMGAQKWISISKHESAANCIDHIKSKGYQVVATTPHHDECSLADFDVLAPSCFFFGRETDGLSKAILDRADSYLTIPMYGFTESLNISVSAAIILQSVTRKLRNSDIQWRLPEEEQLELKLDWCKKTIKSIDSILERYQQSL